MTTAPSLPGDTDPVIVVSGLPRSGTSLMMQILSTAGVPVLVDDIRRADTSNPAGYFEYEPVKRLHLDSSWLNQMQGRAVKVVAPLLTYLPLGLKYRILFMERPLTEVVLSQEKMLLSLGKSLTTSSSDLAEILDLQTKMAFQKLSRHPDTKLLRISYADLVHSPDATLGQIFQFLERPAPPIISLKSIIDPQLYRSRESSPRDAVTTSAARLGPSKLPPRFPSQDEKLAGIVVVSVPKSGTNFLSQYLARVTGWRHRWGRPSRDIVELFKELPPEPDSEIYHRAVHLIATDKDLKYLHPSERPTLFGGRRVIEIDDSEQALQRQRDTEQQLTRNVVIAEHPLRSLAYWLRNPLEVPVLNPQEVIEEGRLRNYGVLFLHRDFRDVINSLAHFLLAGTRYVQFGSWEDSIDIVLTRYAPVLANAIRVWKSQFDGFQLTYESLTRDPRKTIQQLLEHFELPPAPHLIETADEFQAFTFRKGGSRDWCNHLTPAQSQYVEQAFSDLVNLDED